MELFTQTGGEMLARWGHYLAGVTWIGLLYYFNFVQTPAFAAFEAPPRTEAIQKLVPRALWWFRYGALLTLLTGLTILAFQENLTNGDYYQSAPGRSIATGILLAVVMFANVWAIIWPNQKIFIENAERTAAGQEALPNAASAARKAACASRTNTLFSIPMLFFMVSASHFNSLGIEKNLTLYWIITFALVGVMELNALVGTGQARQKPLSTVSGTIHLGLALTFILFAALWLL